MSRTAVEFRQQIQDEGWAGHPLADDLVQALSQAEARLAAGSRRTPIVPWSVAGLALVLAACGVAWGFSARSDARAEVHRATAEAQQLREGVAQREREIGRLKELATTQLSDAVAKIQASLGSAESVMKSNATMAESNRVALSLLVDGLKQADRTQKSGPSTNPDK